MTPAEGTATEKEQTRLDALKQQLSSLKQEADNLGILTSPITRGKFHLIKFSWRAFLIIISVLCLSQVVVEHVVSLPEAEEQCPGGQEEPRWGGVEEVICDVSCCCL